MTRSNDDAAPLAPPPLELWGGVECTVNRVGDETLNQLEMNGHLHRADDLERIASLGLRTLRFPLLWELIQPDAAAAPDWQWTDARMRQLQALRIAPIAGLVHHGSGPRHAPLGSEAFAPGLAEHARRVAERYPWIEAWTPVNEPLTTARFAGYYGFWYPHGRDARTFARCLMSEIEGTVAAMRAVRRVNPAARLVQTDDLGYSWSTERLAPVAEFENERRWLAWDLLAGRVDRHHPLYRWLREAGVTADALARLADEPCPPDVVGINHYVTSERFLDERRERYPERTWRIDGPVPFADVEAVRVLAEPLAGLTARLLEAWERYRLPLAVTEAHLGCTRDEQMRWLVDLWDCAREARGLGADVRAVTVWALLGSYDWHVLVTRRTGHYECGPFDVRGGTPRPTALAQVVRSLAAGREPDHPALQEDGWWRRPVRLLYPPATPCQGEAVLATRASSERRQVALAQRRAGMPADSAAPAGRGGITAALAAGVAAGVLTGVARPVRPLLVIGATGTLGGWFGRLCELRGLPYRLVGRDRIDITDPASIQAALADLDPWAVVNCAGYVRVDEAERDRDACFRANALGPALLARACEPRGIRLVTFSSDLVFDGAQAAPYVESADPSPLNVYGESKLEAERRVLEAMPQALVVRTSAFFSPTDRWNFVRLVLDTLGRGERFRAAGDLVVSPTYVPDLVDATLDLLIDDEGGLRHLANAGEISWAELARRAAEQAGLDASGIDACEACDLGWTARRPRYSALATAHPAAMPTLDDALARFARERSAT